MVAKQPFDAVFLLRHGVTTWNLRGRRQGRQDAELTSSAGGQIRANAQVLADQRVSRIVSSPLGRAAATAEICGVILKLPVTMVPALVELDHGAMTGLTNEEMWRKHPNDMLLRSHNKYEWRFPGGESYADVDRRVAAALLAIRRTDSQRPLIVSHEMVGRMLLRNLLNLDPAQSLGLSHPFDVVYRVNPTERTLSYLRIPIGADFKRQWTAIPLAPR